MEEAGVPEDNNRPWESNCNIQSRAWTQAVLVVGLYELLGDPTT